MEEKQETKKGLMPELKEEERKIRKAAEELDIKFPEARGPFGINLIALFFLIGGVALVGTVFTDIFGPRLNPLTIVFRTTVGVASLFIAYGLIKKLRWSLWLYGLLMIVSIFFNPVLAVLYVLVLVYLLTRKDIFKKGKLDNLPEGLERIILKLTYGLSGKTPKESDKFDIITIGSATRDVLIKSQEFKILKDAEFATGQAECFALGSKIEIKDIVFTSGGGGTNTAVTFARQELKTACIGTLGEDVDGEEIIDELVREGVGVDYFQRSTGEDSSRTAYSVILVHPSAERTILSYKGEGQHFNVGKVPFDRLKTNWLFLDSLGGHYDLLEAAVKWAKGKGIRIATNPGGKELEHGLDKLKILLENADIVIMNQEEAAKLTGIDYKKEDEVFKFVDEMAKGIFIMSKGPEGVAVSDGKKIYRAGIPDSPIVERTGAGDAFSSGFVAEYIKSDDIEKAIQFATANASSVVSKFGAKAGILKKGDWGPWPLVKVDVSQL